MANTAIATRLQVSPTSVVAWGHHFCERTRQVRTGAFRTRSHTRDSPREDRRYRSPDPVDHARLSYSLELPVDGQDRKRECGHRAASVVRTGPRPHLVKSSKFSKEAHFDEKLADVVGLYHHPLDWAMALRMDQKSQIQMLDRSQPLLPRKKERAGTMNHDYERSGGATLLAALNVLTEVVVGERPPRRVFRVPASSRPQTSEITSSSSHFG